jgi:hypothetical protein
MKNEMSLQKIINRIKKSALSVGLAGALMLGIVRDAREEKGLSRRLWARVFLAGVLR